MSAIDAPSAYCLPQTPKNYTIFASAAGAATAIPPWVEAWKSTWVLCVYDENSAADHDAETLAGSDPRAERCRPVGAKERNDITDNIHETTAAP